MRQEPLHLKEEDLLNKNPEQIGGVRLNYRFYSGEDLYSDGAVEEDILKIAKEASRVEFPGIIEQKNSWPVMYHLSPLRGNIIDWLPIGAEDKVLEIGSGCGAITDKLSGKAQKVTCVELSARRSLINAYRNQDRNNIEIYVGNFSDIEPSLDADYDYICMIGVFEYAKSYIQTPKPYEDFLRIMQKHVKNSGRIIIAIENKFGLKYWAGCKEDHLGTWFSGLEGYPEGGSAKTFVRSGLERIFQACGVKEYSFYYPYPDYKFPTTIYSDRRLPALGELTDNLRNFDRDRMALFNEKYVYDGILEEQLFPVFSNSYLAVLGKAPETAYVKYSNDRAPKYSIRTEISDTKEGRIVRKFPCSEEAKEHLRNIYHSYELLKERYQGSGLKINPCCLHEEEGFAEFPYEKGVTLAELMDRCLEQEDMDGFERLFDRYYQLISYGEEHPVADYDLIFSNILVDGESWTAIDYEWTVSGQVPASEIAFRAVYCYVLEEEKRNKLNLDSIITKLGITQTEAQEYREKEKRFQKQVTGKRKSMGDLKAAIGTYEVDSKLLAERYLRQILEKRIQIYYDRGNGYSEEDSFYMPDIYTEENKIEAEISVESNVKNLRIDPADRPCVVKLEKAAFNGVELPIHKRWVVTNGKSLKAGCYVFDTRDPNINFKLTDLPVNGISVGAENTFSIKMELAPMPEGMARDVAESVKKLF